MSPLVTSTSRSPSPSRSTSWMPDEPQAGWGARSIVSSRKLPLPSPRKADHRLVLLRDEGDEVQVPVPVEIGDGNVNGSRARVHEMRHEDGPRPVRRPVLEERDVPDPAPPEGGHDQVEVPVPVEISGLDVGHAGQAGGERDRRVRAVGSRPHPGHGSLLGVAGHGVAEVRHQQVRAPVAIEIDGGDLAGARRWPISRSPVAPALPSPARTSPASMSTATTSGGAPAASVSRLDVGDGRRSLGGGEVEAVAHEAGGVGGRARARAKAAHAARAARSSPRSARIESSAATRRRRGQARPLDGERGHVADDAFPRRLR